MTSKTFKCVEHEEEVLEVYPFTGEEAGRKFSLLMPHVSSNAGIAFDSTTAPALMQAIGECLPPIPDTVRDGSYEAFMTVALEYLGKAVRALEAETAEAEDQAKLEAEALELFNQYRVATKLEPISSWDEAHPLAQEQWLAVARKAREMRAEQ